MDLFKYYVALRAELLAVVSGVDNANYSFSWDTTPPNWATKMKLEKLYKKYRLQAAIYGLYVVTRHLPCGNEKHPQEPEYAMDNDYGLVIGYQTTDENYSWQGGQMYQGPRHSKCPFSVHNKSTEHYVIDDVIYHKDADQKSCKVLEDILYDIHAAIGCAEDKKTRSAIRENLLLAILKINDALLPEPMDQYIQKHISE